LIAIN
jgi:hypothetical protein